MFEIKNLLNRRTVKNFSAKKIPSEILANATRIAYRTPTSLNSRPVILVDISSKKNESWIAHQAAVKTAPHLFLLAVNPKIGEQNARKFLSGRFGTTLDDIKVSQIISKIMVNRESWACQQIYLTAGYFSAILEASGISGCWIAGFEKEIATKNLNLPAGYSPELIFACGYKDVENPENFETEFARSFEEFYFPEN